MRFPFTFLGITALVFGLWVMVYVLGHRQMDPFSQGAAVAVVAGSWVFGAYVVVRRVRRGPQN